MGLLAWLVAIVVALLLWWFGFVATKQMRIDKNKERTAKWEAIAARQKAEREAAAQLLHAVQTSTQQNSEKEQDLTDKQ